jgi:hypothetical protein
VVNWKKITILASFLVLGSILLTPSAKAQGPRADCYISGVASTTGLQALNGGYDNRGQGFNVPCTIWHLVYFATNVSTLAICAAYAPDAGGSPGSFSCAPTASGVVPLTNVNGQSSTVFTYAPWVNVNITTLTGVGAGVKWQLLGWRPGPSNDAGQQPNSINSTSNTPLFATSQSLQQSYVGSFSFTNPANSAVLSNVFAFTPLRTIYFDRIIITSTVATSVLINATNTAGSTCTAQQALNMSIGANATHPNVATFNNQCGTPPTVVAGSPIIIDVPANTSYAVDMSGFIVPNGLGSAGGIDVIQSGAIVGVESISIYWHEN